MKRLLLALLCLVGVLHAQVDSNRFVGLNYNPYTGYVKPLVTNHTFGFRYSNNIDAISFSLNGTNLLSFLSGGVSASTVTNIATNAAAAAVANRPDFVQATNIANAAAIAAVLDKITAVDATNAALAVAANRPTFLQATNIATNAAIAAALDKITAAQATNAAIAATGWNNLSAGVGTAATVDGFISNNGSQGIGMSDDFIIYYGGAFYLQGDSGLSVANSSYSDQITIRPTGEIEAARLDFNSSAGGEMTFSGFSSVILNNAWTNAVQAASPPADLSSRPTFPQTTNIANAAAIAAVLDKITAVQATNAAQAVLVSQAGSNAIAAASGWQSVGNTTTWSGDQNLELSATTWGLGESMTLKWGGSVHLIGAAINGSTNGGQLFLGGAGELVSDDTAGILRLGPGWTNAIQAASPPVDLTDRPTFDQATNIAEAAAASITSVSFATNSGASASLTNATTQMYGLSNSFTGRSTNYFTTTNGGMTITRTTNVFNANPLLEVSSGLSTNKTTNFAVRANGTIVMSGVVNGLRAYANAFQVDAISGGTYLGVSDYTFITTTSMDVSKSFQFRWFDSIIGQAAPVHTYMAGNTNIAGARGVQILGTGGTNNATLQVGTATVSNIILVGGSGSKIRMQAGNANTDIYASGNNIWMGGVALIASLGTVDSSGFIGAAANMAYTPRTHTFWAADGTRMLTISNSLDMARWIMVKWTGAPPTTATSPVSGPGFYCTNTLNGTNYYIQSIGSNLWGRTALETTW